MNGPAQNNDRELFSSEAGSIHVTENGGIGINVGGYVYVKPLAEWHRLAGGKFGPNGPEATRPERIHVATVSAGGTCQAEKQRQQEVNVWPCHCGAMNSAACQATLPEARLIEGLTAEQWVERAKYIEREHSELRAFVDAAFQAHPNLDLDIAAVSPQREPKDG